MPPIASNANSANGTCTKRNHAIHIFVRGTPT